MKYRRVVSAVQDGRWAWDEFGEPYPFEEVANYSLRRVRHRFTPAMLDRMG